MDNKRHFEGCLYVSIRYISDLKLKNFFRKGYQLYASHVLESTEDKGLNLEDYSLL
jgi:hypothetical protein